MNFNYIIHYICCQHKLILKVNNSDSSDHLTDIWGVGIGAAAAKVTTPAMKMWLNPSILYDMMRFNIAVKLTTDSYLTTTDSNEIKRATQLRIYAAGRNCERKKTGFSISADGQINPFPGPTMCQPVLLDRVRARAEGAAVGQCAAWHAFRLSIRVRCGRFVRPNPNRSHNLFRDPSALVLLHDL